MCEYKSGDKVVFRSWNMHSLYPKHFPEPGTAGTIVGRYIDEYYVQWEPGSTSIDDLWIASADDFQKA